LRLRQDQTILGHVLKHALITMYVVVEDEVEVVILSCQIWTKGCNISVVTLNFQELLFRLF